MVGLVEGDRPPCLCHGRRSGDGWVLRFAVYHDGVLSDFFAHIVVEFAQIHVGIASLQFFENVVCEESVYFFCVGVGCLLVGHCAEDHETPRAEARFSPLL